MYLGWFDDNPKKPTVRKIEEGIDAYVDRFKTRPNVVLVNEVDMVEVAGIVVRKENYIRRNNFWIGWEVYAGNAVLPTNEAPAPAELGADAAPADAVQVTMFE